MKIKTNLQRLLLPAACCCLLACQKQEKVPEQNPPLSGPSFLTGSRIDVAHPAANPENPYDSLGMMHNLVLDEMHQYAARTGDTTRAGGEAFLRNFLKTRYQVDYRPRMPTETGYAIFKDYHPYMLRPELGPEAKVLMRRLTDILDKVKDANHFDDYKKQIIAVEQAAQLAPLSKTDRQYFFSVATILRFSGYYWMEYAVKVSGGGLQVTSVKGLLRKIAGVITGIAADASVMAWLVATERFQDIGDVADWSYICGYYTGWWSMDN